MKVNNFEFKVDFKSKDVYKYAFNNNHLITIYLDKKRPNSIFLWMFNRNNGKLTTSEIVTTENLFENRYSQSFFDLHKNILVSYSSKHTQVNFLDLNNFKFEKTKFKTPYPIDSVLLFKSKIYDNKLIQALHMPHKTKIRIYPNYLKNNEYNDYEVNENNVFYYSKKHGFTKKNVTNLSEFNHKILSNHYNLFDLELTPFISNDKLILNLKFLEEYHGTTMNGLAMGGIFTRGEIRTSIINDTLYPYRGKNIEEVKQSMNKNIEGELVMKNYLIIKNKLYLTYYDLQTKEQVITEIFR